MKDILIGRVTDVLDLETIDVEVTQIVRNRYGEYNAKENVRFSILQHEMHPVKGIRNRKFIEVLLKGKGVMCLVNGRDARGCIEADVYSLGGA